MRYKRGVFFSTDALIALAVILTGTLLIIPLVSFEGQEKFVQSDIVIALSSLKIGELNNSVSESLIAQGLVEDLNKSVLEQIGEFYVTNETIARNLSESIFEEIDTTENFGIWFGDKLVASKNSTPMEDSEKVIVEKQLISGIKNGSSVTAYSSRAFLSSGYRNKYFYLGGYVGDGNISARIEYYGNISAVEIEAAISDDFNISVNDDFEGNYSGSANEFLPVKYSLNASKFNSGVNIVNITGNNLYIGGGFIRVTYEPDIIYSQAKRQYFPGIEGIINYYDGFYVPEELEQMEVSLHYFGNITSFLNIGNVTVYNDSEENEATITLNNAYLSSLLDYSTLSGETIPLRFGFEGSNYVLNTSKQADVVSVSSLAGQMNNGNPPLIEISQSANRAFINALLDFSIDNRVGLIPYGSTFRDDHSHPLSSENESLISVVDNWKTGEQRCVCCGVNNATNELAINSTNDSFKSMVVMSDGGATQTCLEQGAVSPADDAIQAACDAYNNENIRVYTVGFGTLSKDDRAMMLAMAQCGDGNFYEGDINSLIDIYNLIADDIIRASFFEQTATVSGEFISKLWPDSYIEFTYNESEIPFGLVTTTEKGFTDTFSGTFELPENATILETRVISYSGKKWTDNVWINETNVYNLSKYGGLYIELGDPYAVNVPNEYINRTNVINLTTALAPGNFTGGTINNKIIYTVVQANVGAYSSLSISAEGCNWTLEFESGNNLVVEVPNSYTGSENCYYTSTGQNISDTNDALQISVMELLELLDFDSDGRLDVEFTEQNLGISSSEITGIPFSWSTEMQVRTWN